MKLRVCLFCFCCLQHTFVESKTTKPFSEVKSSVFSLSSFQRCRQKWCVCLVRARCNSPRKLKMYNVIIGSPQVQAVVRSLSFILHQQSSKSIYTQNSSRKYDIVLSKPRNNISYRGPRGSVSGEADGRARGFAFGSASVGSWRSSHGEAVICFKTMLIILRRFCFITVNFIVETDNIMISALIIREG